MVGLSIRDVLDGNCIFVTGGLGFLGSVCLEQLLRLTEVRKVYLLVRGKKHLSANDRVQKLLCGPLFHKLHAEAAAGGRNPFHKVHGVEGDMDLPGLGLSPADKQLLLSEVDVVIHSAANLTLDAHIQDAIKSNYLGTKMLLQLAREMQHLHSFVHISTYFVNNFKPYNTPVKEEVHYPTLQLAGDPNALTSAQLVDYLLTADRDTSAAETSKIMSRLNFISTYAFSKLLTEQLVDSPDTLPGVAKVIIRPSLISSIANEPYKGYIAGFAGSPGYSLAYGMGCFHDISTVAFASDSVPDVIPVDLTAALVIAAAASASAHGPYGGGRARVYHSASAESYPQHAPAFFDKAHRFWTLNPPPFVLPFKRYPTYSGRHHPSAASMWFGTMLTSAKVWLGAQYLKWWMGKPRQATALVNGFKAFCVQNSPGYARSIVSCMDHGRELEASIVPAERNNWQCVWQERPGMCWEDYSWTALTGLRTLALRMPESGVVGVPHSFERKQGLSDSTLMQQWMDTAGISRISSCTSSCSICSICSTGVEVSVCAVTSPAQKGAAEPVVAIAAAAAYAQ